MRRRTYLASAIAVVAGCSSDSGPSNLNDKNTVNISPQSFRRSGFGGVAISVRIEAERAESIEILLADPDGNTVDSRTLTENALLDGGDRVELETPGINPGQEFKIQVAPSFNSGDRGIIGEKSVTIPNSSPTIQNARVNLKESSLGDGYFVKETFATVKNTGKLSCFIESGTVTVGEQSHELGNEIQSKIPSRETKEVSSRFYIGNEILVPNPPAEASIILQTESGQELSTKFTAKV